jgi:hypothetical protein
MRGVLQATREWRAFVATSSTRPTEPKPERPSLSARKVVETFDLVEGTRTVFGKEFLMADPGVGDVIHDVGRVVSTLRSTSRSRQDATTWFTEELARISINSPAPFWRATKEQRPTGCSVDRAVEALCASRWSSCRAGASTQTGVVLRRRCRSDGRAANGQQTRWNRLRSAMPNRYRGKPESRMNRAIPRPSSPFVVTLEPACHAGGRGFESRRSHLESARKRQSSGG